MPRALIAALAVLATTLMLAACGETKNDDSSSSSSSSSSDSGKVDPNAPLKKGMKTVSIPKQLGNPYEEFEHSGVDEALKELGGTNTISGPTDAGASTQIPIINAAVQKKPDAIIIAGNDPNAVAPALKQAAQKGVKIVGMDSDVAPDARSVFINQVTTELVGKNQVESIARQIDNKGQIAILSATANATNQNAWIKVMKDTLKDPKYKDIKLVKVAYGDDDDQKSFQQMQGLIQAYPNLKGVISPTTVGVAAEGQDQADRARLPEPDAQVREGRHGGRVPAVGPQGRRLSRGPGRRGARGRPHLRQGGREVQGRASRRVHDRRQRRDRARPADDVQEGQHRQVRLLSRIG
jgi:rhamnose transport system substrate-binding protein